MHLLFALKPTFYFTSWGGRSLLNRYCCVRILRQPTVMIILTNKNLIRFLKQLLLLRWSKHLSPTAISRKRNMDSGDIAPPMIYWFSLLVSGKPQPTTTWFRPIFPKTSTELAKKNKWRKWTHLGSPQSPCREHRVFSVSTPSPSSSS